MTDMQTNMKQHGTGSELDISNIKSKQDVSNIKSRMQNLKYRYQNRGCLVHKQPFTFIHIPLIITLKLY